MKQWVLPKDADRVEHLVRVEAAVPQPGPRHVRIKVTALSINARDRMVLAGPFGRIPGLDIVPLSDVAGTIDALGDGVEGWSPGDRVMTAHVPAWQDGPPPVFGTGPGSLDDPGVAAEYIVVDASALVATPGYLTDAEASTLQVAGVTAWNAVFADHPVTSGDRVVVIGSGGLSLYAAQLARAAGADVYVVTREPGLDERWQAIGVAGSVSSADAGWGARLHDITGGASKVVDTIGPGAAGECLDAVGNGGEVAVPGLIDMSPPTVDVLAMIGKQSSLRGVAVGSVRMHRDLAAFMTEHQLHPVIDATFPFEHLARAYDALATPGVFGKIVVEVR